MRRITCLLLLQLFSFVSMNGQTARKITKSSVTFRIKNAGAWVNGSFGKINGTIKFDEKSAVNFIDASVEANTISTKNDMRDKHLKKDDFFNAEKHPLITINSKKITKQNDGSYLGDFSIAIKGTIKNMQIPFTVKNNVFSASFSINRQDFNVGGSAFILNELAYVVVVFATE